MEYYFRLSLKYFQLGTFLMISTFITAQSALGYDNFAPMLSSLDNPAHLGYSRSQGELGVSFNYFSSDTQLAPSLGGFNLSPDHIFNVMGFSSNLGDNALQTVAREQGANVQFSAQISGFKSIKDDFAIGLALKQRASMNFVNYDRELWSGLAKGFGTNDFAFTLANFNAVAHYWQEYALSASAAFRSEELFSFKVGGSLKLTRGLGYVQMENTGNNLTELSGSFNGQNNNLTLNSGSFAYLQTFSENNPKVGDFLKNEKSKLGVAGDFGVSMEFRTERSSYSGARAKNEKAVNKYVAKISASILDLGRLNYEDKFGKDTITISGPTIIDVPSVTTDSNNFNNSTNLIQRLEQISATNPNVTYDAEQNGGQLWVVLPTALFVEADVKLEKNVYFNASYRRSFLTSNTTLETTRVPTLIQFSPRYERQEISGYFVISYDQDRKALGVGVGGRFRFARGGTGVPGLKKVKSQAGAIVLRPWYEDWDDAYYKNSRSDRNRRRNKRRR
ncbi:hypothetical protein [Croceivirga thetidis]|uniref:DUF5723 domain-containing protein n=1 Tax=Croceivirga thetidis TaxID=2721623 RepID=A0ABX1GM69_9FLAO|nr:hypothetical protein [Croceivirga thetidis]NKI30988.1 hypothetical protein [Croceivirga thetidis]